MDILLQKLGTELQYLVYFGTGFLATLHLAEADRAVWAGFSVRTTNHRFPCAILHVAWDFHLAATQGRAIHVPCVPFPRFERRYRNTHPPWCNWQSQPWITC